MAEFIFKKTHYTNPDSIKDRQGVHKKGDFINCKPDGWSEHPNWQQSKYPEKFVVVKCPEITIAEAIAANWQQEWRDDFGYEILSLNPAQGRYTITIYNLTESATGANQITLEKVESFLLSWLCDNISFSGGAVNFELRLWQALQSDGFWQVDNVVSHADFRLIDYSGQTGLAIVEVSILSAVSEKQVLDKINENGGTVTSNTFPVVVFEIFRDILLDAFRNDVKRRAEKIYKRHLYGISENLVDSIDQQGGIVTITRAQLLNYLINHMDS